MEVQGPSLKSLIDFLQQAARRYEYEFDHPLHSEQDPLRDHSVPGSRQFYSKALPMAFDVAWQDATRIFDVGGTVNCIVTGWNRGGLLVRWNELQGFVPASQLKDMPVFEEESSRDEILARWVGEELNLKVIELDRGRNRLVFSERATLWGPKDGDHLLEEITPDQVRDGRVSNLCDFGAFVDLGGIDGLVHISELSWGRVNHPREMLSLGEFVRVYVISVDKENRRVALSLKRLRPDPWSVVEHKYEIGAIVDATITNVVEFGAFARIEDGLEGLIHVSELSPTPVAHPAEMVQAGDQVRVRILRVDSSNHRLGLSLILQPEESTLAHADDTAYDGGPQTGASSGS